MQWHADIDGPSLATGTRLNVLSEHHVVRVVASDTIALETPDGLSFSATVLDRTAAQMKLALADGRTLSLSMLLDESLHPQDSTLHDVFSRQLWLVH